MYINANIATGVTRRRVLRKVTRGSGTTRKHVYREGLGLVPGRACSLLRRLVGVDTLVGHLVLHGHRLAWYPCNDRGGGLTCFLLRSFESLWACCCSGV